MWRTALASLFAFLLLAGIGCNPVTSLAGATGKSNPIAGGNISYLPIVYKQPITPILRDTFTGSGALSEHSPETGPPGSKWQVTAGEFAELSGGWAAATGGNFSEALIDSGVADFELVFRARLADAAERHSGVTLRRTASGGAGDSYAVVMLVDPQEGALISAEIPGVIGFDPANQPTPEAHRFDGILGEFYTWQVLLRGSQWRVLDDQGAVMAGGVAAANKGNTLVGLVNPAGATGAAWDSIEVRPLTTHWKSFSVIGDSISANNTAWNGIVSVRYGDHLNYMYNHAVAGAKVSTSMDQQTDKSEADGADFTIIALGTNDSLDDFQAEYLENLVELWGSLGRPIYAMGVLPKTGSKAIRETENGYIQAAGVDVTYWNTDGWIDPLSDTSDGLHPNAAGNEKIASRVLGLLP